MRAISGRSPFPSMPASVALHPDNFTGDPVPDSIPFGDGADFKVNAAVFPENRQDCRQPLRFAFSTLSQQITVNGKIVEIINAVAQEQLPP